MLSKYLRQLQAAQWLFLFEQVTQSWSNADVRRHWWKTLHNTAIHKTNVTNKEKPAVFL